MDNHGITIMSQSDMVLVTYHLSSWH